MAEVVNEITQIDINMIQNEVPPASQTSPTRNVSQSSQKSISSMEDETSFQATASMSNVLYIGARDKFLKFEDRERVDWDFYKRKADAPDPLKYLIVFIVIQIINGAVMYYYPTRGGAQQFSSYTGNWLTKIGFFVIFLIFIFIFLTFLTDTFFYYCKTKARDRSEYKSCLRGHAKKRHRYVRFFMGIIGGFIFIIYCCFFIAVIVHIGSEEGTSPTRLRVFIGLSILFQFLSCFLFIDYLDALHVMMRIANSLNTNFPWSKWAIMGLNMLGGLALMVIINLDKEEDVYRTVEFIIMFFMFYLTIVLLVYFWDIISFTLGNNEYSLSMIFFTFFGAIFIFICRWLHDPDVYIKNNQWAWHRRAESISKTLNIMIVMSILITVFYPIGGGILSACFASFANMLSEGDNGDVSSGDVVLIVSVFMVIAHLMMIAPFAPASLIDVCGGFIFVQIFQKVGWTFTVALLMTLGLLCASHFTGSCLQWYLGRIPLVQGWLNRTCPVVVLATLDASLKNQGWFRVGLIGSIAPDTINGFAQGRSNLPFWTQFISEWSAIPNAICTILIGAALSEESLLVLTPILILVALAVNLGMASWALRIVAEEVKKDAYIKSNFKWQVVQNMVRSYGYTPTKDGWKNDVWNLKELYKEILPMEKAMLTHLNIPNISPLDHKIIHDYYVKIKRAALAHHCDNLIDTEEFEEMKKKDYVIYQDRYMVANEDKFFWDYELGDGFIKHWKYYMQVIVLGILWCTMAFSSMVFSVSTEETVEVGLEVVTKNDDLRNGVIALGVHAIVAILYFYQESIRFVCRLGQRTKNVFINICGCDKENSKVETNFETPAFEMEENELEEKKKKYLKMAVKENRAIFQKCVAASSSKFDDIPGMGLSPMPPNNVEMVGSGANDNSTGTTSVDTHDSPVAFTPSGISKLGSESYINSFSNTKKLADNMKRDSAASSDKIVLENQNQEWVSNLADPNHTPDKVLTQPLRSHTSDV